jgi:hypothetical protein
VEIPAGHGGGLRRPVVGPLAGASVRSSRVWLRRGTPPPGDDGEAGGSTQGGRRYRPSDGDGGLRFFPLAPSPAPASVSIAGGLLRGAARVKYAAGHLLPTPNRRSPSRAPASAGGRHGKRRGGVAGGVEALVCGAVSGGRLVGLRPK